MQAQVLKTNVHTKEITATQSLTVVKTLLQAGLGCITYLRDLLPADNFSNGQLIASKQDYSLSFHPSDAGNDGLKAKKRDRNHMPVMTITRGFTEEADKLLNFLEHGIFDALEKQYLKSFIFAIYLDNEDPNNIVEAYTFNFNYYQVPGIEGSIPVMSLSLASNMEAMSQHDPAADASKDGRVPTFGEVKKSLRLLVKQLITATTGMEHLPKSRFASFKLFYHDRTPPDYEPPNFRSGDSEIDKWTFATHDGEIPEHISIGKLQTPFHGVDVHIASVASFLPTPQDVDTSNLAKLGNIPPMTPVEHANAREAEIKLLKKDAEERRVIWSAEAQGIDADAEGEIDPEYAEQYNVAGIGFAPLGVRNDEGKLVPIIGRAHAADGEEVLYAGESLSVPSRVGNLHKPSVDNIEQTQPVEGTQQLVGPDEGVAALRFDSLAIEKQERRGAVSSQKSDSPMDQDSQSFPRDEVDTQALKNIVVQAMAAISETQDTDMLDLETQQPVVATLEEDAIQSFDDQAPAPRTISLPDNGLQCVCGIDRDDDTCFCEGGCGFWFHVWCMGYHSIGDKRLPVQLICFDCRLRRDPKWDLVAADPEVVAEISSRYTDLALFRRAIKVAENKKPDTPGVFARAFGRGTNLGTQLFHRLERENFIAKDVMDKDGILTIHGQLPKKSHHAKNKQRKSAKPQYSFVFSAKRSAAYREYFDPRPEAENRILKLSELVGRLKLWGLVAKSSQTKKNGQLSSDPANESTTLNEGNIDKVLGTLTSPAQQESQTQAETQLLPTPHRAASSVATSANNKRKASADSTAGATTSKKVKISLAAAVDLGN